MLTHELSDAASWDLGKMQQHFWPVKPVLLFGRPAKLPPHCPVEHAVWYGWRDIWSVENPNEVPHTALIEIFLSIGPIPRFSSSPAIQHRSE